MSDIINIDSLIYWDKVPLWSDQVIFVYVKVDFVLSMVFCIGLM